MLCLCSSTSNRGGAFYWSLYGDWRYTGYRYRGNRTDLFTNITFITFAKKTKQKLFSSFCIYSDVCFAVCVLTGTGMIIVCKKTKLWKTNFGLIYLSKSENNYFYTVYHKTENNWYLWITGHLVGNTVILLVLVIITITIAHSRITGTFCISQINLLFFYKNKTMTQIKLSCLKKMTVCVFKGLLLWKY